jgi:hypothetical protein
LYSYAKPWPPLADSMALMRLRYKVLHNVVRAGYNGGARGEEGGGRG